MLAVGALHYMKGYRFLISALGQMPAQRRPALVIAANSAEAAEQAVVTELAARLGVPLRVENVRDDACMVELYRTARVFVYTPIEEALGLAPLEAMACGTPVVAVGEAGISETVLTASPVGWLSEMRMHSRSAWARCCTMMSCGPGSASRLWIMCGRSGPGPVPWTSPSDAGRDGEGGTLRMTSVSVHTSLQSRGQ